MSLRKFLFLICIICMICMLLIFCTQKLMEPVVDEWTRLQQVLVYAEDATIGKIETKSKQEALIVVGNIIAKLQTLSFKDDHIQLLRNKKIEYYQVVWELLASSNQQSLEYEILEQRLLKLSQENYELEQQLK